MKKIVWAIALLSIFAGVFYSCNKESNMTNDNVKSSANTPRMSAEDVRIMNLIVDFKKKVDFYRANPNIKSGESKSVDSTVWYLEAATNFYHAAPSYEADQYDMFVTTMDLPKTNGRISMTDIQAAYDQMESTLNNQYASIDENEKQLVVTDVALEEDNANSAKLKVSSGIGKGSAGAAGEPWHGWYWGRDLGRCADPGYDGEDAADIFTKKANHDYSIIHPTEGYYTDIISVVKYPDDLPAPNNCNFDHSKLFSMVHQTDFDDCISDDCMDAYYSFYGDLIDDFNPGGDYEFSMMHFDDETFDVPPHYYKKYHKLTIDYGIWHVGNPNPNGQ